MMLCEFVYSENDDNNKPTSVVNNTIVSTISSKRAKTQLSGVDIVLNIWVFCMICEEMRQVIKNFFSISFIH